MKKLCYGIWMGVLLLASGASFAQVSYYEDPRYGVDSASRAENVRILNFLKDAYDNKEYDVATVYVRTLIANAPQASENIYIRGAEIYRRKAAAATSKTERMVYVDSLLWIHDKRIEAFGAHPSRGESYIRNAKARDFNELSPDQKEQLFKLFREAIASGKHQIDPGLVVTFFNSQIDSYRKNELSTEDILSSYTALTDLLQAAGTPEAKEASDVLETLLATSTAASCETLEKIYKPQYEAAPDDLQLIEKIIGLGERQTPKCSSPFFMSVLEKYYKLNPRPEVAAQLAGVYEAAKNYSKSLEYLRVAIANESNLEIRVGYLVRAAGSSLSMGNYREAANFAQQALNCDPERGIAYFFLANAYIQGAGTACSDFDRQTVYWLVVDTLLQARKYSANDPSLLDDINRTIATCSANYPKAQETFMRGLEQGQSYQVNCGWISGRTTVRER